MLEVVRFIFQDFWHWLGALIMLSVVSLGMISMVALLTDRK